METVTLITGGARSGKSRRALRLLESYEQPVFVATAEPVDEEMKERIRRHREDRPEEITTIEEPVHLARAVDGLPDETEGAVIDCLPVWLGNLFEAYDEVPGELPEVEAFLSALESRGCSLIVVTGEVGMGIVPARPQARAYRDRLGRLNQEVARRADAVELMVSGISVSVKGDSDVRP